MSFRVVWNFPALVTFYSLPMHSAFMIDRAVVRFAETGEGELAWEAPHHLLSAGFHDAVLAIDREARTITVLRIYRVR
ncbi:hypothetical protein [Sorangium sp. So ce233]|uniref:hypothetical protein n=1 Tax=Sorangium sp. So ce233 TaxID=3133290 RepID=UPI003F6255C5